MTKNEQKILDILKGEMTQRDIAGASKLKQSEISRVLRLLVAKGLVVESAKLFNINGVFSPRKVYSCPTS